MRTVLLIISLLSFSGCAVLYPTIGGYTEHIYNHDPEAAYKKLQQMKNMKAARNSLLYFLEAGKIQQDLGNYELSNQMLNMADHLLESNRATGFDIAKGIMINNSMMAYQPQHYEPFFVHYYKAINYSKLGLYEDAAVEARRIDLTSNLLLNKQRFNPNQYKQDAFATNFQGLLYEQFGDVNNAFIAYRNAAKLYQQNHNSYYGVELPAQLSQDLQKTSMQLGILEPEIIPAAMNQDKATGSELILFIEQGFAPMLVPVYFELNKGVGDKWRYDDGCGEQEVKLSSDSTNRHVNYLRVALTAYQVISPDQLPVTVETDAGSYRPELAYNINELALMLQHQQLPLDMAFAAGRALAKTTVNEVAKSIGKDKENSDGKTKTEAAGELISNLVRTINNFTEIPDLRSWSSLPAFIYYLRIPLKPNEENTLTIRQYPETKTLKVHGKPGMQLMNIRF